MGKAQRRQCYIGFLCLVAAAFFRFALTGYAFLALMLAATGVCLVLHAVLPRVLKRALVVLIVVWLVIFTAFLVPVITASKGNASDGAGYLIVLGAKLDGKSPSPALQERLVAAKAYLDRNPDCVAILTGGKGENEEIAEATGMFHWMTSHGVPGRQLLSESRASDTEENLRYSFALIDEPETKRIAVVSSEYHLLRASLLAKREGVAVETLPARTRDILSRVNYTAREACGLFLTKLLYLKASIFDK